MTKKKTIEEKFEAAVMAHMPTINDHLREAEKHLRAAKKIADARGIPFLARLVTAQNLLDAYASTYVPNTFGEKFSGIDPMLAARLTGTDEAALDEVLSWNREELDDDKEDDGWMPSMDCEGWEPSTC